MIFAVHAVRSRRNSSLQTSLTRAASASRYEGAIEFPRPTTLRVMNATMKPNTIIASRFSQNLIAVNFGK